MGWQFQISWNPEPRDYEKRRQQKVLHQTIPRGGYDELQEIATASWPDVGRRIAVDRVWRTSTYTHADPANTHGHIYSYADGHTYSHSNGYANTYADNHTYGHSNGYADTTTCFYLRPGALY